MNIFSKLLKSLEMSKSTSTDISSEPVAPAGGISIYFSNGQLYKIIPEDTQDYYDANYLISDNRLYDLSKLDDINSIIIPEFKTDSTSKYDVTGSLDYVLRMKASRLHDRNEKVICSAMLWKSTELMLHSNIDWKKEDYNRLIYYHNELGMFDEALKAEKFLQTLPFYHLSDIDARALQHKEYIFSLFESTGEDLVLYQDDGGSCCAECSKMLGRVYSVYGKNKDFPRLPDYVKEHGNFHSNCRCSMLLWSKSGQEINHKGQKKNAIKMSWRPYTDTRSQEARNNYQLFLTQYNNEQLQIKERYEYSIRKGKCQLEYDKICELLPQLAPKSLRGYMRMKSMQTKNFLKLKETAMENGIFIE